MKRIYCLMILLLCATSVLLAQKKAEIEFKQTKYDFHEIAEENGDVSHVFTFINKEEFYKLKYCSTVVYMVPRA